MMGIITREAEGKFISGQVYLSRLNLIDDDSPYLPLEHIDPDLHKKKPFCHVCAEFILTKTAWYDDRRRVLFCIKCVKKITQ